MDENTFFDENEAARFIEELKKEYAFIMWENSTGHQHTAQAFNQRNLGESNYKKPYVVHIFRKEHATWVRVYYTNSETEAYSKELIDDEGGFL